MLRGHARGSQCGSLYPSACLEWAASSWKKHRKYQSWTDVFLAEETGMSFDNFCSKMPKIKPTGRQNLKKLTHLA